MRKGFIVFSVLMLAIAAADVSAQMGSRRGSGRVGPDRAAKTQEKPQNSVDQLALILAELQEDLKLTADQQAATAIAAAADSGSANAGTRPGPPEARK
jgi:hypothetical protein